MGKIDISKKTLSKVDTLAIANEIVKDHQTRIKKRISKDGKSFPANKKSTVKSKGHNRVLINSEKLYKSIKARKISANESEVYIEKKKYPNSKATTTDVAHYMNDGTRKHIIVPKKKGRFLSWAYKDGTRFFAKAVKHPGTHKYNWFGVSKLFLSKLDKFIIKYSK